MDYYKNVEPSGNGYRVRLRLGLHQALCATVDSAQEAATQADYLRAWLRATLPDCLAEKYEVHLTATSTPPRFQDEKYKALLQSIPKMGSWVEQIVSAPEWIAKFISRIMSTEEITPTTTGHE